MDEAFSLHRQSLVDTNPGGARFYIDAIFAFLWNSLDMIILVLLSTAAHLLFSSEKCSRIGCLLWFVLSFGLSLSCVDSFVMLALTLYLLIPKSLCLLHLVLVRRKHALLLKWLAAYVLSIYIYYHTAGKSVLPYSRRSPFWLHELCWIIFVWFSTDWPWMQLVPTKSKIIKWSSEEAMMV